MNLAAAVTSPRAFWALLAAGTALSAADITFSLILNLASPGTQPVPWQARVLAGTWLASLLLVALAGVNYAWRAARKP